MWVRFLLFIGGTKVKGAGYEEDSFISDVSWECMVWRECTTTHRGDNARAGQDE
jgi:hypothetical protein